MKLGVVALAATLVLACAAPPARADGDPASDTLLFQDVYYPYAPATSKHLSDALDALLKRARKAGYPMKVALIEAPADLGVFPQMINDPQSYANQLALELRTLRHGRDAKEQLHLLVVSAAGFAGDNLGPRVDEALAPVRINTSAQSDGLAQAAMRAVARLATVNGHPLAAPPAAGTELAPRHESTKRKGPSVLLYILPPLAVVVLAGLGGRLMSRRREGTAPGS
jgi:hypothetical protein